MAKVLAVCKSKKKGTRKTDIKEGVFKENYGLTDDAHADSTTHRQVSFMATESIQKMIDLGPSGWLTVIFIMEEPST